ncbi:uncharacterized protein N7479_002810 [Penicillium vulpinum]|uniref:uncharacterized protein n=1 Tax=Penicillium vulpinum TaxID=29845 RepID=UPI002548235B|nr:uncharacterized protein N7479_002810 [Penicillium vulpinum]KAJ5972892.1 hypothetical protein N7479_002810 [Penicillium vulpinum]
MEKERDVFKNFNPKKSKLQQRSKDQKKEKKHPYLIGQLRLLQLPTFNLQQLEKVGTSQLQRF